LGDGHASSAFKFVVKACISASFEGLPKTKEYLELVLVGIGLIVSDKLAGRV
jgi:hypothetical protein